MKTDPVNPSAQALPRRVLLAEDNALLAMDVVDLLSEAGVETVSVTSTVADALKICTEDSIDFGLLDFQLDDGSGVEIARALQARDIPFAFASGMGDAVDLPEDLLGSQILRKPYFLTDLVAAMRR